MEGRLADELRVKGCHEQVPLLQDDRSTLVLCEHPHIRTDVLHGRSADEHVSHRMVDALDLQIRFE